MNDYPIKFMKQLSFVDKSEKSLAITSKYFDKVVSKVFEDKPELAEYMEFVYRQGHTQKEYIELKQCTSYRAQENARYVKYYIIRYARKTMCFEPFMLKQQLEQTIITNNENIKKLKEENKKLSTQLKELKEFIKRTKEE